MKPGLQTRLPSTECQFQDYPPTQHLIVGGYGIFACWRERKTAGDIAILFLFFHLFLSKEANAQVWCSQPLTLDLGRAAWSGFEQGESGVGVFGERHGEMAGGFSVLGLTSITMQKFFLRRASTSYRQNNCPTL